MIIHPQTKSKILRQFYRAYSKQRKPYYVTTPIFYVNASPHLGHIYSMLLADTKVRWSKLDPGVNTYFLTGTDEHGLKIQAAAEKQGVQPQEFVDRVSENFKYLVKSFDVLPDRFIRTTDEDHVNAVQNFWDLMVSKNLIYKGSHSGWYSISDEAFYSESQVAEVTDPVTGTSRKVSKETNNEVVFHEEENYFFRLSAFKQKLLEFLESNPDFVNPPQRYRQLLETVKTDPFEDLSVSRPSSRLTWGISVPGDASQKIYVWFDALVNYLTAAGYPNFPTSTEKSIWPADVHVVGKDIVRFHCIFWPIFLMAAGLELPRQVLVHSHWLSDGVKMSKSLGNVVDPIDLANYYGSDATRFYLMEKASIFNDCKFSESELYAHHSLLINKWANICSRIGGSKFDLARSVEKAKQNAYAGIDDEILSYVASKERSEQILSMRDKVITSINTLYEDMDVEMSKFGQMRALQRWWETVELGNEFFQICEPWTYNKQIEDSLTSVDDKVALSNVLDYIVYIFGEVGRVSSICVSPFLPNLSSSFLTKWNVLPECRSSLQCLVGADQTYGEIDKANTGLKVMEKLKKRHID